MSHQGNDQLHSDYLVKPEDVPEVSPEELEDYRKAQEQRKRIPLPFSWRDPETGIHWCRYRDCPIYKKDGIWINQHYKRQHLKQPRKLIEILCDYCDVNSKGRQNHNQHMATVHSFGGDRVFPCPLLCKKAWFKDDGFGWQHRGEFCPQRKDRPVNLYKRNWNSGLENWDYVTNPTGSQQAESQGFNLNAPPSSITQNHSEHSHLLSDPLLALNPHLRRAPSTLSDTTSDQILYIDPHLLSVTPEPPGLRSHTPPFAFNPLANSQMHSGLHQTTDVLFGSDNPYAPVPDHLRSESSGSPYLPISRQDHSYHAISPPQVPAAQNQASAYLTVPTDQSPGRSSTLHLLFDPVRSPGRVSSQNPPTTRASRRRHRRDLSHRSDRS